MLRLLCLGLSAIALLTAGSLAAIWYATEPRGGGARSRPTEPPERGADPTASPFSPQSLPMAALPPPGAPPPQAEPLADYTAPAVPIANTAPPIQTAPIVDLPDDADDRKDALLDLRRRRFADQMQALNRRSEARARQAVAPAPAPQPGSTPGAPGPGSPQPSRRSSLSPAAPKSP
ncbi:MAG TPA: hypothetical protein VFP50_13405 [Anaeromyxobacteraceae bacterium]|nr:hypothetical protein [Anaeromyxobacteraceae bacterium]